MENFFRPTPAPRSQKIPKMKILGVGGLENYLCIIQISAIGPEHPRHFRPIGGAIGCRPSSLFEEQCSLFLFMSRRSKAIVLIRPIKSRNINATLPSNSSVRCAAPLPVPRLFSLFIAHTAFIFPCTQVIHSFLCCSLNYVY